MAVLEKIWTVNEKLHSKGFYQQIFGAATVLKLFDIRFSYKHCNFSRVCLLVKTASKTVTRSIKKLPWWWKTCKTHLASISRVYKYLLSKQWFYTISGPFFQMKSANMHRWNIFLIEALSMLASPQIKTVKPPDKKPSISDKPSFFSRRSVRFQFVWQKLLQYSPGRVASKACWLTWFILRIPKAFVRWRKMCLMVVSLKRT